MRSPLGYPRSSDLRNQMIAALREVGLARPIESCRDVMTSGHGERVVASCGSLPSDGSATQAPASPFCSSKGPGHARFSRCQGAYTPRLFRRHCGRRASDAYHQDLWYCPRTVTEAIHAMEADGHVVRHADLSDRRAKVWSLTSAGGLDWIDIDAGVSRTIYGGHLQTG
jgi:hypothetical protein